jgi:hypothetical protein
MRESKTELIAVDISEEQQLQLEQWARAQHIPLQALVDAVFQCGCEIFAKAGAQPEMVKAIMESIKREDEREQNEEETNGD